MGRAVVRILHVDAPPGAGPLERLLADARVRNGERHVRAFRAAGADEVALLAGPPDDTPFGRRLDELIATDRSAGIVVLGSGALPLATQGDRRAFVAAARSDTRSALTNNRYSSDVVAIARPAELPRIPDLAADNAMPRWLAERAGWSVIDLRGRWRLAIDLDSPLDLELIEPGALPDALAATMRARRAAIMRVFGDAGGEVVVAGRTSGATVRWLERNAACRVRALIEERGLRSSDPRAQAGGDADPALKARPPRSTIGMLIDRDGPEALGALLAELGDAALVDTRVHFAHRAGVDEHNWPPTEDRFASDLLLAERVAEPWLRALTASAASAPIPVLLGGHTLVGPGARLVARGRRRLRR
jgi:hypothetical protein